MSFQNNIITLKDKWTGEKGKTVEIKKELMNSLNLKDVEQEIIRVDEEIREK
jgi:hypothetical protein